MVERKGVGQKINFFNGLQPSKQAADLVYRALRVGIDPSPQTRKAAAAALTEGRRKVGGFGGAKEPLNILAEQIESARWKQTMNRSPVKQI